VQEVWLVPSRDQEGADLNWDEQEHRGHVRGAQETRAAKPAAEPVMGHLSSSR